MASLIIRSARWAGSTTSDERPSPETTLAPPPRAAIQLQRTPPPARQAAGQTQLCWSGARHRSETLPVATMVPTNAASNTVTMSARQRPDQVFCVETTGLDPTASSLQSVDRTISKRQRGVHTRRYRRLRTPQYFAPVATTVATGPTPCGVDAPAGNGAQTAVQLIAGHRHADQHSESE